MVDKIMLIVLLCVISSVMCRLIEKYNKEQSLMLAIAVCTVILGFVLLRLSPVLSLIEDLCTMCSVEEKYALIIFKSLGICYITQFACDICRDCNENAIATAAEISGKSALMIISLPLIEELVDFVKKLTV